MKKSVFPLAILFLVIFVLPLDATAQRKVDLGEAEFSYAGLYVRGNVGFGAGTNEWIDYGKNNSVGVTLGGRLGYRFTKGLGLHGVVSTAICSKNTSSDWDPVEKFSFMNFGGGPSFYFGKGYSYLFLEVVYTQISINDGAYSWKTNGGIGGTIQTGYDFNVAKNLGLGISVFAHIGSMVDEELGEPIDVINLFYGVEVSIRYGR